MADKHFSRIVLSSIIFFSLDASCYKITILESSQNCPLNTSVLYYCELIKHLSGSTRGAKLPPVDGKSQQTEEILNSILPPREWTEGGHLWVQQVFNMFSLCMWSVLLSSLHMMKLTMTYILNVMYLAM